MTATASMKRAKRQLAVIWFVGAALICLLLGLQSIRGIYGDDTDKAWAWLLPSITPTLSLIIGTLVSEAQQPDRPDSTIDGFYSRLASIFSIAYLVTVSGTILVQPFSTSTPLGLMSMSHFWLAPFQGLVSAALGALFVRHGHA